MKRYQKLGKCNISPLVLNLHGSALDIARQNYAKYAKLDFATDLLHYMQHGFVICQPQLFCMFKPIWHDGQRGWFVQMAVGEIGELLRYVPCPLSFIAFCRNGDDNMRVIEWGYFMRRVAAHYGYKKEGG